MGTALERGLARSSASTAPHKWAAQSSQRAADEDVHAAVGVARDQVQRQRVKDDEAPVAGDSVPVAAAIGLVAICGEARLARWAPFWIRGTAGAITAY